MPAPEPGSNSFVMIALRCGELNTSQADESVNEAPKPVIDCYVVFGLIVMVCPPEPPPALKVAPGCGDSLRDWSAVVSVTVTEGPAA